MHSSTCHNNISVGTVLGRPLSSKFDKERSRRQIIKYGDCALVQRPVTENTSKSHVTGTQVMQPRLDTTENRKYNLKVNALLQQDALNKTCKVPGDSCEDKQETTFQEKGKTKRRTHTRLKSHDKQYKSRTRNAYDKRRDTSDRTLSSAQSSRSSDTEWGDVAGSAASSDTDDVVGAPWEDTPVPTPESISDSDQYDTDLETDFKRDCIADSDAHIGRTVYVRECQKLGVAPQSHVIASLPHKVLTLKNRSLGSTAIKPLFEALKVNLRVERLNLDGVDVTDDGIQALAEMLLDNVNITHLNVSNNRLGMRGAQVLGHVMVVTSTITSLNLSGNKLDEKGAWYLTSGIGSNTSITALDLSYNELGEEAGVLLGAAIARNNSLRHLNISWNQLSGRGGVAVFRSLLINTSLETLNASWNGTGYAGTVALCKSLKRNTSLRHLNVSSNRLDWRCAFLMAEGLRENSTLQTLIIGENPLTTTGAHDLLESVATDTSAVTLLDCSGVPVLGSADLLAATVSRRRPFRFLHGGIVHTHDKIGQRVGREVNPMLRIIEYLRLLGLRPLELLKTFNKSTSFELQRQDFVEQIKRIGVKMHPYEIDALANSISGKGYNKNVINYRKLSMAVREVVEAERERKHREREEWLQMKHYHDTIMNTATIDEYIAHTPGPKLTGVSGGLVDPADVLRVKSYQTIGRSTSKHSTSGSKPGSVGTSGCLPVSVRSPLLASHTSVYTRIATPDRTSPINLNLKS